MFPWKHQPTEGEKELRSPDKKGTAEFYPHTVQQAELITRFAHLPWEDAVGVHGAVLLGGVLPFTYIFALVLSAALNQRPAYVRLLE